MNDSMNGRWLGWCLTGIVVFLAVIAVELSALVGGWEPTASAQTRDMKQFPNRTQQSKDLLAAQNQTNRKLDQILQHLRTQTIKVRMAGTDTEVKGKPPRAPSRRTK